MHLRTTLLALGLALAGSAHALELDEAQSRHQGAVTCIDRLFYDGGYSVGDAQRTALINEFLSHYKLPAYDETAYSQAQVSGTQFDMTAYMAGYQLCDEDVDYVTALGKRHGRELPEG
ncbi:hypothetical protein HNP46_006194 [Pseudomonas nitritireducens]|uniref:Uncharacterized protein n=1 Tax=Pseudomonas nitroreducens TaxID=46680 RepID=A0A7W7KRR0_PSENT|nr:hypothetical protein [Pseudomonas nitritireducens]MBB4867283.1 hypothetical protein [Pseudomonas nitritireducens]